MNDAPAIPARTPAEKKQDKHDKIVAFVTVTGVFLLTLGFVTIAPVVAWAGDLLKTINGESKGRNGD